MLVWALNVLDSAVPPASATVSSTELPVQSKLVKRWKTTLPVGSGTPAGVPAVRVTNALSCTTVADRTLVMTPWPASWTSVRTVSSAHSFVAGPLLAPEPLVWRVSVTPPTDAVTWALTTVVPAVGEVRVIVQLPVAATVAHGFGVVNEPGPLSIVKLIGVAAGAFANPEPLLTLTCAVKVCVVPTGLVPFGVMLMFASTTASGSQGPSEAA